jgi:hypothetical protein
MDKQKSYWRDQRDLPDSKYGKQRVPNCECTHIFTCRACLDYATTRNLKEQERYGHSTEHSHF